MGILALDNSGAATFVPEDSSILADSGENLGLDPSFSPKSDRRKLIDGDKF